MPAASSVDVAVLGAGPAGLMAALRLARAGKSVAVFERAGAVGGMAGSFEVAGVRVDYGSHRLHRVVSPRLRAELEALLGDDLQERERRGRIALQGRWLKFPLQAKDLVQHLPRPLLARIAVDTALGPFRKAKADTAGEVIAARLGPTVARHFYAPYLAKLWDTPIDELSSELADRRVSARSSIEVVRKALTRQPTAGRYLYPRRGFGQISEAIADAATEAGADIRLNAAVSGIDVTQDESKATVTADGHQVDAALVLSTIPVPLLARLAGAPAPVLDAAGRLRHRAMVLAYLALATDRLTSFDAHYFPELNTPVSRMNEPKNYRDSAADPTGVTVVCAEIPCWEGDATWNASADELAATVQSTLTPVGFDFPAVIATDVRRIARCYPVYTGTYAEDLAAVEAWADTQPRLLTFGRQGLYAPDNTHHVLDMGWEAADAIGPDNIIDLPRWHQAREEFRENVVED